MISKILKYKQIYCSVNTINTFLDIGCCCKYYHCEFNICRAGDSKKVYISTISTWYNPLHAERIGGNVKVSLQWRHNERDGVSKHRRLDCWLKRLFRRRSKKTLKLRVTGLCEGNSPVTGEFPSQRASNAENVSIWWRHHDICSTTLKLHSLRRFTFKKGRNISIPYKQFNGCW